MLRCKEVTLKLLFEMSAREPQVFQHHQHMPALFHAIIDIFATTSDSAYPQLHAAANSFLTSLSAILDPLLLLKVDAFVVC